MKPKNVIPGKPPGPYKYQTMSDSHGEPLDIYKILGSPRPKNVPADHGTVRLGILQSTPPLTEQAKQLMSERTGLHFVPAEWLKIEAIRQVCAQAMYNNKEAIEYDDLINRLENIVAKARSLLDAVEIYKHVDVVTWARLSQTEGPPFDRDEIYPVITQLVRRASLAAEIAKQEKGSGKGKCTADPRINFVAQLADILRAKGLPPTASTPSTHADDVTPSLLMRFVMAVSISLPPESQPFRNIRPKFYGSPPLMSATLAAAIAKAFHPPARKPKQPRKPRQDR